MMRDGYTGRKQMKKNILLYTAQKLVFIYWHMHAKAFQLFGYLEHAFL